MTASRSGAPFAVVLAVTGSVLSNMLQEMLVDMHGPRPQPSPVRWMFAAGLGWPHLRQPLTDRDGKARLAAGGDRFRQFRLEWRQHVGLVRWLRRSNQGSERFQQGVV